MPFSTATVYQIDRRHAQLKRVLLYRDVLDIPLATNQLLGVELGKLSLALFDPAPTDNDNRDYVKYHDQHEENPDRHLYLLSAPKTLDELLILYKHKIQKFPNKKPEKDSRVFYFL